MKLSEKQWLERIYLQEDTDGETTWCQDKINDDDCEYIRADKHTALKRVREYVEEVCEEDFVMWCREQDALLTGGGDETE